MKYILISALCLSALLCCSCATITFDATNLLEPAQLNAGGTFDYTTIGNFTVEDKAGWILGIIPVNEPAGSDHTYFKEILTEQISRLGGEGSIGITIKTQRKLDDYLLSIVTLGIYQTRTVEIRGEVVRYE